jgi:hypothetical protein
VAVVQKFHNTLNELQHKSVSCQWLNILLSLVEEEVEKDVAVVEAQEVS